MKYLVSVLVLSTLLFSCVEKLAADPTNDLIKNVETSLTTYLQIAGDCTWSIEDRMEHYGIPGASIAVIHDGKIAWTKGYGVMDKESQTPVTDQTLFQASALSIPVSAYGALRFVEQQEISLDENINHYLTSWQLPDNEFTQEKKATIRNILNHSAGITLHSTPGYPLDAPLPTLVEVLNGTSPAENEPVLVLKEPDESFYISYTGYGIIQQMMVDLEEKPFASQMDELVLQPLGMTSSTFKLSLTPAQINQAATAYLDDGTMVEGKRFVHPVSASRGLWTTPEDLAKFIVHIQQTLKGNRTEGLSKEMTELMVTPHSVSSYGPGSEYGLGFQLFAKKEENYLRHWGWNRGYYSEMIAHKEKEHGVVVMTNTTIPAFNAEVIRAVALAYEWKDYVPMYTRVGVEPSLANQITGTYQSDDLKIEVFLEGDLLYIKNVSEDQADELVRVSDHNFVKRNSSRLIQFNPDPENGRINLEYLDRNSLTIVSTLAKVDEGS